LLHAYLNSDPPCLEYPYVEGGTLVEFLDQARQLGSSLAPGQVERVVGRIAQILAAAHRATPRLVHRDLKPANVLLERRPGGKRLLRVTDFGIGAIVAQPQLEQARTGSSLQANMASVLTGSYTPLYASPQQSRGDKPDPRDDVYALGVIWYQLLAHDLTSPAPTGRRWMEPLRDRGVSEAAIDLLASCLESDPAYRPEDAGVLAERLLRLGQAAVAKGDSLDELPVVEPAAGAPRAEKQPAAASTQTRLRAIETVPAGGRLPPATAARPAAPATRPGRDEPAMIVRVKRAGATPQPAPKRKGLLLAAVAAGVLLLGLVGLWASGLLKVKTKDGVIVLDNLPVGAEVFVDGDKVTVTWDGNRAEIGVKPGTRQIVAKKDGIKVFGEEVEIEDGGRQVLSARLEPLAKATPPAASPRAAPRKPPPRPPTRRVLRPAPPRRPPGGTPARSPGTTPPGDDAKRAQDEPDSFVSLFNGKDLSGWKSLSTGKATWEVKDGVLTGSGHKGYLFNDGKSYENFHLRVEAMINDGGNSGVFFRAPYGPTTPQGDPASGYEAQINITQSDPRKTGSLFAHNRTAVGLPNTSTELDKWFTLEVVADGPHIVVKVNDKITANYIYLGTGSRSGRIALQVWEAPTVVKFRKIEIKELPPRDPRLQWRHSGGVFEQVKDDVWLERRGNWAGYFRADKRDSFFEGGTVWLYRKIENNQTGHMHITRTNGAWWNVQGSTRWTRVFVGGWSVFPRTPLPERSSAARIGEWVSLLNGKDLSGWETAGNKDVAWTYEADALVGRSSAEPAGLLLSQRADYENFDLRMETQLSAGTSSSLLLRCGPPNDGATGNKCYAVRIGGSGAAAPLTGTLVLSARFDDVQPLPLADAKPMSLKPAEWFPLEVIAYRNRLLVLVAGKIVVDYTDANGTFTIGRLELVCHGKSVVHFRKLEIRELPPTKPVEGK
jgi:hypothetical protein